MEEINDNGKNNNMKGKTGLIIVASIILICLIVFFILYKLNIFDSFKNGNVGKISSVPTEDKISSAESLTYSPVRITCGSDETATPGFGYSIYEGDNLYCTFSIMTYAEGTIDEIWFDYEYNEKFKYLDSNLIYGKTQWDIDYSIKKDEVKVQKSNDRLNFNFKDGFSKNLYNFYVVEFKSSNVNNTGYYEPINISNIIMKTKDGKYYKYTEKTSADGSITITADANTTYSYKKTDNVIDFYKGKDKINTYKCTGDSSSCFVGAYMGAEYTDLDIGRSLITDSNSDNSRKYLLFDFNKGILKQLDGLDGTLTKDDSKDYKVYYILGKINSEQVIIDLEGNVIKNLSGYDLFKTREGKMGLYTDVYSINNNKIVLSKNGKKGIVELTTDKVIVDFKYDDVRLYNKQYFKYKLNDLWYIGKYEIGSGINDLGYKNIFMFENDIMIAQIDNYLYIKKYDGTNIIEDKIEVLYDYQEFVGVEYQAYGVRVNKDDTDKNIININLTTKPTREDKSDFETISYKYSIIDKKLTKTSN